MSGAEPIRFGPSPSPAEAQGPTPAPAWAYLLRCPDGIYRRGGNVVVFCNNGSVYIEQNQISTHRFHSNSNRYCLDSKISGM